MAYEACAEAPVRAGVEKPCAAPADEPARAPSIDRLMLAGEVRRSLPLFHDRVGAGRELARALRSERPLEPVVFGLARGGVEVAAEVALALDAPLDAVAVRKVGHPWQPEYALGAVAAYGGVYVRAPDGLSEEELAYVVARARRDAAALAARLHRDQPPIDPAGRSVILVDDGLATGSTMIAAVRWATTGGASRIVAAVPVAARQSLASIESEADEVVCPHVLDELESVGQWYRRFGQLDDGDVVRLLAENRGRASITPRRSSRGSRH